MVVTLKLLIMIARFPPFAKVHLTDNVCVWHTTEPIEKGASRVRQMTCIWMTGVSGLGNPTTQLNSPSPRPETQPWCRLACQELFCSGCLWWTSVILKLYFIHLLLSSIKFCTMFVLFISNRRQRGRNRLVNVKRRKYTWCKSFLLIYLWIFANIFGNICFGTNSVSTWVIAFTETALFHPAIFLDDYLSCSPKLGRRGQERRATGIGTVGK